MIQEVYSWNSFCIYFQVSSLCGVEDFVLKFMNDGILTIYILLSATSQIAEYNSGFKYKVTMLNLTFSENQETCHGPFAYRKFSKQKLRLLLE